VRCINSFAVSEKYTRNAGVFWQQAFLTGKKRLFWGNRLAAFEGRNSKKIPCEA